MKNNVSSIRVNKTTFNVAQAPASEQKRLLSLIGAKVALSSAMSQVEKIDHDLLLGALLTLKESDLDEIADIVLYKTVKNNAKEVITIGDFQNDVSSYYILIAKAIEVNLKDFFTYLDSVNKKARETNQK